MTEQNDQEGIVNRVAQSSLITLDLEEYYHTGERVVYDIKDNLYEGLILKEQDFRDFVKGADWSVYQGKNVAITCSTDAIIPTWAYMLLVSRIEPYAHMVIIGSEAELEKLLFKEALDSIDPSSYEDFKIVIKGCGHYPVPEYAYGELTRLLRPYAKTIMYGEPCSTVPVYKKSRQTKMKK